MCYVCIISVCISVVRMCVVCLTRKLSLSLRQGAAARNEKPHRHNIYADIYTTMVPSAAARRS